MHSAGKLGAIALSGGIALFSARVAQGQEDVPVNDKPFEEKWWPAEFGPDDKAGSINRITPDVVLKAMKLVKRGKTATLGKYYASDIPFFGARTWTMVIPGTPTGGPAGKNALIYHDEFVSTEIGQVGTQFDGPGHIGVHTSKGNFMYNGRRTDKIYQRGPGGRVIGLGDSGVEHVAEHAFVCRGIVLNAPAYRGMERLPVPRDPKSPGIVTAADVQGMLKRQGLGEIGAGDCVFLYTGHGDLWSNATWKTLSPERKAQARKEFGAGEPGFGISACQYLAQRKIALMGGDTWGNDADPAGEQEGYAVPCHTEMQTRRGIWNLENLDFGELLKDDVSEFLFVWAPLKIIGATGSPGNPVAIY